MKMFVVLALAAFVAAEPEADPQLLTYSTGIHGLHAPLTYNTVPVAYNTVPVTYTTSHVASVVPKVEVKAVEPVEVKAVEAVKPVVYSAAAYHPTVYTTGYHHPTVYTAPVAVPTHTVTSYNNADHYTAVSNGAFGPSYVAKNHGVEHVVKREAEADPALLYTSAYGAYPYYNYGLPYAGVYSAPVVKSVVNPVVKPVVHTYAAATGLVKTPDHAVAVTPFGAVTHSANVGVCTNVHGVQVPC